MRQNLAPIARCLSAIGVGLLLASCSLRGAAPGATSQVGRIPVQGGELAYEETGSGPAVVLVHGGLVDRRLWDDQVPALARDHRVIRYDLRGYGESSPPTGAYSHVEDLHRVMEHLRVERGSVVGLSIGGAVATEYALGHPQRVRALVLIASAIRGYVVRPDTSDPAAARSQRAWRRAFALRNDPAAGAALLLDSTAMGPVSPAGRERMRTMLTRNLPALFGSDPALVRWPQPPALARLGELRVPTLVIVGDRDDPPILTMADTLAARVAGLERATIAGGTHHPNLDARDEMNRLLRTFLTRHGR